MCRKLGRPTAVVCLVGLVDSLRRDALGPNFPVCFRQFREATPSVWCLQQIGRCFLPRRRPQLTIRSWSNNSIVYPQTKQQPRIMSGVDTGAPVSAAEATAAAKRTKKPNSTASPPTTVSHRLGFSTGRVEEVQRVPRQDGPRSG